MLSTEDLVSKAQDHPKFQNLVKNTWSVSKNLAFKSVKVQLLNIWKPTIPEKIIFIFQIQK